MVIVVMMMTLMVVVMIMMMVAVMMVMMMMVLRGNSASCKYPWLSQTADYYPEDTRDNDDVDDDDDDDDRDPDYSLSKPRMGHFCIKLKDKVDALSKPWSFRKWSGSFKRGIMVLCMIEERSLGSATGRNCKAKKTPFVKFTT